MGVGYSGVSNFANTYPGTANRVFANASELSGWGTGVGGASVIVQFGITPPDYYIELQDESGVISTETTGKILLEIS